MSPSARPVTRFAPSPTGHLHLGHAYSALLAFAAAQQGGGRFVLRIEDIDSTRCRPEFEAAILEDLAWLGLAWEPPIRRQSEHMADYRAALQRLKGLGLLYPCFCTRAAIAREIAGAAGAPHGPDGPVYPGTCRRLRGRTPDRLDLFGGRPDVVAAVQFDDGHPVAFCDVGAGERGPAVRVPHPVSGLKYLRYAASLRDSRIRCSRALESAASVSSAHATSRERSSF